MINVFEFPHRTEIKTHWLSPDLCSEAMRCSYLKCVIWFSSRAIRRLLMASKFSFSSTLTVPIPSGLRRQRADTGSVSWRHHHVWTTDQKLEVQTTLKRCNTSINQNHFLIWGCYYTGSGTLYKLVLLLVETTVSDKRAAVTTQLGRLNGLAAIK